MFWENTLNVIKISPQLTQQIILLLSLSHTYTAAPTVNGPSTIPYNVQKDSNITIVCNITGIGVSYKWMFQGSLLKSDNTRYFIENNTLTLLNTKFTTTGNYTCSGENLAGKSTQNHIVTILGKLVQSFSCTHMLYPL